MVEDRDWTVQISPKVDMKRTPLLLRDLPESYDGQFYNTWIAECDGLFWCPWIVWDIDNTDVKVSLNKCREFVEKLLSVVPRSGIRIVFSTAKGFHIRVDSRIVDLKPSRTLHSHLRRFCLRLLPEADASLYAPNHLIGIPNSLHRSTGLYYVPIAINLLYELSIAEMRRLAEQPKEFGWRAPDLLPVPELVRVWEEEAVKITPGILSREDMCEKVNEPHEFWNGVARGDQRKNKMYRMANDYRRLGLSIYEVFALMQNVNFRNRPNLTNEELRTTINSSFKLQGVRI